MPPGELLKTHVLIQYIWGEAHKFAFMRRWSVLLVCEQHFEEHGTSKHFKGCEWFLGLIFCGNGKSPDREGSSGKQRQALYWFSWYSC